MSFDTGRSETMLTVPVTRGSRMKFLPGVLADGLDHRLDVGVDEIDGDLFLLGAGGQAERAQRRGSEGTAAAGGRRKEL